MSFEFKDIGGELFSRLKGLQGGRANGEFVKINDVANVIESVIHSFESSANNNNSHISEEIREILQHLKQTKSELNVVTQPVISHEKIDDANKHLNEVVKETENAANSIMDAADEIQALLSGSVGDSGEKIQAAVTKIYEACNFQDLTGQRIKNVIKTLENIEKHVKNLASIMGVEDEEPISYDKSLMNGPQLISNMPTQDDIDNLFSGGSARA